MLLNCSDDSDEQIITLENINYDDIIKQSIRKQFNTKRHIHKLTSIDELTKLIDKQRIKYVYIDSSSKLFLVINLIVNWITSMNKSSPSSVNIFFMYDASHKSDPLMKYSDDNLIYFGYLFENIIKRRKIDFNKLNELLLLPKNTNYFEKNIRRLNIYLCLLQFDNNYDRFFEICSFTNFIQRTNVYYHYLKNYENEFM